MGNKRAVIIMLMWILISTSFTMTANANESIRSVKHIQLHRLYSKCPRCSEGKCDCGKKGNDFSTHFRNMKGSKSESKKVYIVKKYKIYHCSRNCECIGKNDNLIQVTLKRAKKLGYCKCETCCKEKSKKLNKVKKEQDI